MNLTGFIPNHDGTYNLADRELIAVVKSSADFKGDTQSPNGIQFLLKNNNWENYEGPWLHVSDEMMGNGMRISLRIPGNEITESTRGISLKFTIGSHSNETYSGIFYIDEIRLN